MMGRQHACTGLLAAAGTAYAIKADVPTFVLLCTTLPGTAILNDIDHPDSTVSSTYGPLTGMIAKVLDHRKQTHSIPGVLVFGTGTYIATVHASNPFARAYLAVVLVLIWAATIRLFHIRGWLDDFAPIPIACLVTFGEPILRTFGLGPFPFRYLPYMIVLGMITHILGDWLTKQKMPLLWPFSSRGSALGMFKAGGKFEIYVILPVILLATLFLTYMWARVAVFS